MFEPGSGANWSDHHVLALPQNASLELLFVLAQMRFTAPQIMEGAQRVARHSNIYGPVFDEDLRRTLGFMRDTPALFSVHTPRERGEPPFMGLPERTGISRACPSGLPIRDEGRVLNWAIAVARRLGGALRIVPSNTVLRPDIESSVDLTVLSPVWLEPAAAHKVVAPALPRLYFHQRAELAVSPSSPEVASTAFGLGSDLAEDGRLDVLIGLADDIPPAWQPAWKGHTPVSYQVRWTPLEIEERELEDPPLHTKIARRRIFDLVATVTARIQTAVGGQIVDDDWFSVDAQELG